MAPCAGSEVVAFLGMLAVLPDEPCVADHSLLLFPLLRRGEAAADPATSNGA
jgi:hypothetical protein